MVFFQIKAKIHALKTPVTIKPIIWNHEYQIVASMHITIRTSIAIIRINALAFSRKNEPLLSAENEATANPITTSKYINNKDI